MPAVPTITAPDVYTPLARTGAMFGEAIANTGKAVDTYFEMEKLKANDKARRQARVELLKQYNLDPTFIPEKVAFEELARYAYQLNLADQVIGEAEKLSAPHPEKQRMREAALAGGDFFTKAYEGVNASIKATRDGRAAEMRESALVSQLPSIPEGEAPTVASGVSQLKAPSKYGPGEASANIEETEKLTKLRAKKPTSEDGMTPYQSQRVGQGDKNQRLEAEKLIKQYKDAAQRDEDRISDLTKLKTDLKNKIDPLTKEPVPYENIKAQDEDYQIQIKKLMQSVEENRNEAERVGKEWGIPVKLKKFREKVTTGSSEVTYNATAQQRGWPLFKDLSPAKQQEVITRLSGK